MISKIFKKVLLFTLNNRVTNNLLIFLKRDDLIKKWVYNWNTFRFDESKSLQENVGCTDIPQIQELVDISHEDLQKTAKNILNPGDKVLDIGSGTGLYLKDFDSTMQLYGVDMNNAFIRKAKEVVPQCTFIKGNYLHLNIEEKFKLIYSFSVFQYIEPSNLDAFFSKISKNLAPEGVLYLHYPHAVKYSDLFYPDLSYIRYSPNLITKKASKYLKIVSHKHFYDDREVDGYDKNHYYFPDGTNKRVDTVQNSYLLIAQKV